jgi:hypothetical protein
MYIYICRKDLAGGYGHHGKLDSDMYLQSFSYERKVEWQNKMIS